MSPRRRPIDPWPWPQDSPLDRSRRVAASYRAALAAHAPRVCEQLDARSRRFGQSWVLPTVIHDDDDLLDTELAADYLGVHPRTIDRFRRAGLRATSTVDGVRYRVRDIKMFDRDRRKKRDRTDCE